ncbi:MAG: biopolymer transporter ExbD [Candidatus Hydrothermota bacterium]|uniref:Biopolymer transporter ExbD n=1 Tax=candidate division WOR-3 bacterium TaxID=2052148 RepID=A0A7C0XAH1_UNCW3|nr:MAG: biopolymer transporter ExbD [Candidatus Hydrothermae bacterium]HDM89862.1 biopolymer transporter ExbD [candidate division WOR-3 bacterium]
MPILKKKRSLATEVEIPTASMADIAFLLIIFFMTTTIFARDKGLKLVLPEKGQEVKVKSRNILKISINDQGQIFAGDQPTTLAELPDIVKKRLAENPKLVILIKTHANAPYELMIKTFDTIKGIEEAKRVALGVIKPGGS